MALQGIEPDDEDDDDDEEDETKNDFSTEFYDCFGNVKDRLKKENCPSFFGQIDDGQQKDNVRGARLFMDSYRKFKNVVQEAHTNKEKEEYKDYPRKHRFCALIDRREPDKKSNGKESKKDEILFFEPPNNCNSFPDYKQTGTVPLWYFDSSRTCIVPNIGYNNGKDADNIDAKVNNLEGQEKALSEPITSGTGCKGALMVLSFHVEADNEIRCYMYLNGQICRFMPEDIINLLPKYFDKNYGNNKTFPKSSLAKELVEKMKPQLVDIKVCNIMFISQC